jgi:hypothetical protein
MLETARGVRKIRGGLPGRWGLIKKAFRRKTGKIIA